MHQNFSKLLGRKHNPFFPKKFELHETHRQHFKNIAQASLKSADSLFADYTTSQCGLTDKQARARLKQFGLNEIAHEKPTSWYVMLLKNVTIPFNVLLIILSVVSFLLGDIRATMVILCMVALSILMRFFQEYRSSKAAEKLRKMVSTTVTVIRRQHKDGEPQPKEIPLSQLVPGDLVQLSAGDMIPGDLRLLSSKDLFVAQAALTGESLPVEKFTSLDQQRDHSKEMITNISNLCFLGTDVVSGTAKGLILATGNQTYFGTVAKSIIGYRSLTSFDKGINQVSWLLIRFMLVLVPLVLMINGFTKGNWFEAVFFALSIAVGLTPEMLPMIVTANLAKGAIQMSKNKAIVKQLNAIQNFGAMDILCTDKTGTLTENHIILEKYLDLEGHHEEEIFTYAYLNSYYQTGLKNLMDVAILDHKERGIAQHVEKFYTKIDEVPFDFERRRMSVIVQELSKGHLMITKGAVEEVLPVCRHVKIQGKLFMLNDEINQKAKSLCESLNKDGLRVLALAYKQPKEADQSEYHAKDESEMILLGFLSFLDPPKDSAKEAIHSLQEYGISIKVLTGDNELVTRKICDWVGLNAQHMLTGSAIDQLDDIQLQQAAENTVIFSRVNPLQKSRIIMVLKNAGHTVGYLGDGINDAAALREADIGISVDRGVDIAKESADIILLEKSLTVLGQGVLEGRKTFGNIIKYIKMAASSNFGNVISILTASVILPFFPMLPLQILIQNLLYDLSQTAIPFDFVDKSYLLQPRKWDASGIGRFMLYVGPVSSLFDFVTFGVLWFVFCANSPAEQSLFQSGWFIEGLLSQTLIVHMIRTEKIPFIQSRPSPALLFTTITIMACGVYIPYSMVSSSMGMMPLPLSYFFWLIGILIGYCFCTQLMKFWFLRRFKHWL